MAVEVNAHLVRASFVESYTFIIGILANGHNAIVAPERRLKVGRVYGHKTRIAIKDSKTGRMGRIEAVRQNSA